jgi:hypothetical protein
MPHDEIMYKTVGTVCRQHTGSQLCCIGRWQHFAVARAAEMLSSMDESASQTNVCVGFTETALHNDMQQLILKQATKATTSGYMTCIAIKYIHVDANIIVFVGNC